MSKTVFILGAGFSVPAGMPIQSDIMGRVVERHSQPVQDTVREMYTTLFNMVQPEDMQGVPLEDVFTMLDRARHSGETIRGLDHTRISSSYSALISAITREFNRKLNEFDPTPYVPFFEELVRTSVARQQHGPRIRSVCYRNSQLGHDS